MLFRSEYYDTVSCGLEGLYNVTYWMRGSDLECTADGAADMENCNSRNTLTFRFRNCSFPNFEQNMVCLGAWNGNGSEKYIAVLNEETREYRCGVMYESKNITSLYFGDDSSCSRLGTDGKNALEEYKFREKESQYKFAPCRFPEWVQGEYETVSIEADKMRYSKAGVNSPASTSVCVDADSDRILVHSESSW
ncbi:Protein F35D2.6 [Aphelenchoides avenae]|nr:Protein F35D2.6 [Aphelenchus avenae]